MPPFLNFRMGMNPEVFKGQKLYRAHIDVSDPNGNNLPVHSVGTGDSPKVACTNALIDMTKEFASSFEMEVLVDWDRKKDLADG